MENTRGKRSYPRDRKTSAKDQTWKGKIDTRFLQWLEGPEDRLPRLRELDALSGADLAASFRATAWLQQYWAQADVIAPLSSEDWETRYEVLESFLIGALKVGDTTETIHKDLVALQKVLAKLLPPSSWHRYRKDILHLQTKGLPLHVGRHARNPSGPRESEETGRMRAAIAYLRPFTKIPYAALADFWNECVGKRRYSAGGIYQRLKKGSPRNRSQSAAEASLQTWFELYSSEAAGFGSVFPGRFPLSREFRDLYKERTGQTTPWDD